jgi:anti-anti-sigma regulatory factor
VGVAATQAFTVTTATAGGACVGEAHVVTVVGDGTSAVEGELELALVGAYEDGGKKVAVDLTEVEPVEPEVLDAVARQLPRFRARGGDIVVAARADPLTDELRLERSVEDALASLLASEGP